MPRRDSCRSCDYYADIEGEGWRINWRNPLFFIHSGDNIDGALLRDSPDARRQSWNEPP